MSNRTIRIQVIFTEERYQLIQKLKGEMGISDSEVVRNIVIVWLVEKSFVFKALKDRIQRGEKDDG